MKYILLSIAFLVNIYIHSMELTRTDTIEARPVNPVGVENDELANPKKRKFGRMTRQPGFQSEASTTSTQQLSNMAKIGLLLCMRNIPFVSSTAIRSA